MGRFGCHHELVQTQSRGDIPAYKCRLCGATLRGRKPETRIVRLLKHWIYGISLLGIGGGAFFAFVLPGFTRREVPSANKFGPEIWFQKDQSPGWFWSHMLFYLGFSIITLVVSVWQFRSIWRETRGKLESAAK
jgi:hypothetical protein